MADIRYWSTTAASNAGPLTSGENFAEGQAPSTVNNSARQLMASVRGQFEDGGWFIWGDTTTYGSGTTFTVSTDVTTRYAVGRRVRAVGSSTGTIYGTISASSYSNPTTTVTVVWDSGSLSNETLTIAVSQLNVTGDPVPGAAVQAASETASGVVELATTAEAATGTDTARAVTPAGVAAAAIYQGKHTIWIPASAMVARTTNGAASGTAETTTNKVMIKTLDFDATTQEFAQFYVAFPKSWNEGTVTAEFFWSHPSTTTNFGVVWQLAGVALSNDDALDTAFGTEQTATDTGGTTDDLYVSPETSAITIAGTPAAGDMCVFQAARAPSNGSDTMAVDARLHGIKLYYTVNAKDDT